MKQVTILKVGLTSKGQNWALITKTVEGFIMKAFVTTEEPLVEGEVLNVPSEVASGIEWKA